MVFQVLVQVGAPGEAPGGVVVVGLLPLLRHAVDKGCLDRSRDGIDKYVVGGSLEGAGFVSPIQDFVALY